MIGQWSGSFTGSNSGYTIINIEEIEGEFDSHAFIFSYHGGLPPFEIDTILKLEEKKISGKSYKVIPINPVTEIADPTIKFPDGTTISNTFEFEGEIIDNFSIKLKWHGKTRNTHGNAIIKRSNLKERSKYEAKTMNWEQFKHYVRNRPNRSDFIYRGQKENWKLRTSFHRAGRFNLNRYFEQDLKELQKYISASMGRLFNLSDEKECGALMSLAQHHGYPTPFLDWTESPFIASYFAFEDVNKSESNGFVRIFVFNRKKWCEIVKPPKNISEVNPKVSFYEMFPIGNERMLPQQSVSMYSNIDELEEYIRAFEKAINYSYLEFI